MHPTATNFADDGKKQTLRTIERNVRLRLRHPRDPAKVDRMLWARFGELISGAKKWPLLLHGPAGTGKSSAALTLCDVAATAMFTTVDELATKVMHEDADPWEWIGSKDLAVLDELGCRATVGDLHYSVVKAFCDAREHLPTIYVTNVMPRDLEKIYDERIFSRVASGTWFHLDGPDRRGQQ
jgi:hypothetical protein